MQKINIQYFKTKIGELILGAYDGKICLLDFRYRKMRVSVDNRLKRLLKTDFLVYDDALLTESKKQIDEYINGDRKKFDLPLLLVGTKFQKCVWKHLMDVPYGSTSTYLQLARNMNQTTAVRAVANANGANAIALIIPCHRIIGSNAELVGYGGGIPIKKRLLKLESDINKI